MTSMSLKVRNNPVRSLLHIKSSLFLKTPRLRTKWVSRSFSHALPLQSQLCLVLCCSLLFPHQSPEFGHNFLFLHSCLPIINERGTWTPCELIAFPRTAAPGLQHDCPLHNCGAGSTFRPQQLRLQCSFQVLSFYFLAAGKEEQRAGLFSQSFCFTT